MKNKKLYLNNFKSLFSMPSFRLLFIINIAILIYNVFYSRGVTYSNLTYIEALINLLTSFPFSIVMLLLMLVSISIQTVALYKKNQFQLIRFQNKETTFKNILTQIAFNVSISYFIYIFCLFYILIIFYFNDLGLSTNYDYYGVNGIIYLVFIVLKSYLILLLISLINGILLYLVKEPIVLLLDVVILIDILGDISLYLNIFSEKAFLLVSSYLTSFAFSNFSIELCFTVGYILILEILLYILYKYVIKHNKNMI